MGDLEQLKSVKIAISEAISRLKICTVINSYFDELADVEQTTAKGLSKIQKVILVAFFRLFHG